MFGVVITVPRKYERKTVENVLCMRGRFKLEVPVEIWEIGEEISIETRRELQRIKNVTFKNVFDLTSDPERWRGFQIKAFAVKHTSFDEILLCDADIRFWRNPLRILSDEGYKRTGTYFFRDRRKWKFHHLGSSTSDNFRNIDFFNGRKNWLRLLLPSRPSFFPQEWAYIYRDETPAAPVPEAFMEAGAVYLDKRRHEDTVETVFRLNRDHESTYRWVWGDKETWWIACCMVGREFTMNKTPPRKFIRKRMTHFYGPLPFFVHS